MRTVINLLHDAVKNYSDLSYLGEKKNDEYSFLTFKECDEQSLWFAVALHKRGFQKGDTIAILSEGRTSWVLGEYGLLKAGCISIPLSIKLTGEEIAFRLNHSEAKVILVSENNIQKIFDIYDSIDHSVVIICISEKNDALKKYENILFFDEMLEEGQSLLDEDARFFDEIKEIEKNVKEDDIVTISYTSGTTGNPKGIMLTHLNYWNNATDAGKVIQFQQGWKTLIMLPLDHSFAHTVGMYIFAYFGVCMCFTDARGGPLASLRNLSKNLQETNPDFLLTVPALSGNFMKKMTHSVAVKGSFINGIFKRGLASGIARSGNGFNKVSFFTRLIHYFPWVLANILVFPKLRLFFGKNIKFCVGGGALLEVKQQEFFNAIGIPICQGYGLTENSPIISTNEPHRKKFGTAGTIIPSLQVRIMKDEQTECGLGEIGQIVTKGDSVMKGYYKNPEATAETLKDGWLWSGDLGFKDADGFLTVTGREKAMLISADAEKYSPEIIEEAILNTSSFINQVMAFNDQCKFTIVLVTLNKEAVKKAVANKDVDAVIALIRDDINAFKKNPAYMHISSQWTPASFAIIPAEFDEKNGLINSTMKLVRRNVCRLYQERINELYSSGTADPFVEGNRTAVNTIIH